MCLKNLMFLILCAHKFVSIILYREEYYYQNWEAYPVIDK
jgi:hypothetical protein